jgi:hypothetical protein
MFTWLLCNQYKSDRLKYKAHVYDLKKLDIQPSLPKIIISARIKLRLTTLPRYNTAPEMINPIVLMYDNTVFR